MGRKRIVGWGYTRAGLVAIDQVLPLILDKSIEKVDLCGHRVNVVSLRLQTFAMKGLECSSCGVKATHFAVETKMNGEPAWHLNLWADRSHLDKEEMLMTHDHTLARGLGGKDHIDNVTTMCSKCNHQKSIGERVLYNEMHGLPAPGTAKDQPKKKLCTAAVKRQAHDAPLMEIPMELAVRQFQAEMKRQMKKKEVENEINMK